MEDNYIENNESKKDYICVKFKGHKFETFEK